MDVLHLRHEGYAFELPENPRLHVDLFLELNPNEVLPLLMNGLEGQTFSRTIGIKRPNRQSLCHYFLHIKCLQEQMTDSYTLVPHALIQLEGIVIVTLNDLSLDPQAAIPCCFTFQFQNLQNIPLSAYLDDHFILNKMVPMPSLNCLVIRLTSLTLLEKRMEQVSTRLF
jgi:hypothetical protein